MVALGRLRSDARIGEFRNWASCYPSSATATFGHKLPVESGFPTKMKRNLLMSFAKLSHVNLHRPETIVNGATTTQRDSADFLVDGESLLARLVKMHGGHGDFMGCFVRGFSEDNAQALNELLFEVDARSGQRRVAIYICPECGDIECGIFSVMVELRADEVIWSKFAYENGDDEPSVFEEIGPFKFALLQYEKAVHRSAEI